MIAILVALLLWGCKPAPQPPPAMPQPVAEQKVDRCAKHVQDVRREHFKFFGIDYPYWYGVGQLKQESGCRADAVSFDGGRGIAQFMPLTEREVEGVLKADVDLMNPKHAIMAQACYMAKIHKSNWDGRLWLTYCFYNSGIGTMKKEYVAAGVLDYERMRAACKRKVLVLKSGATLDLCKVGYDYPKQVYAYASPYRLFKDAYAYW